MIRIGVDVGGTFTDLVCLDDQTGELSAIKVPSTPEREHAGFLDGIQALGLNGAGPDQIVHGTTVATNALLQRKGARVAMLCTAGFRDILEIGRCMRYSAGSLFDTKFVKPAPLVERQARFEVRERVAADGTIIAPLQPDALKAAISALREAKPESIAVCLLNSYANDTHEQEIRRELVKAFPGAYICTSVEVYRGYQEFERFATTALNAFLMPPMARYLHVLEETLRKSGVASPILIMGSSGGTLTPEAAGRLPVRTILSGPVGGVAAAIELSRLCGIEDLITYDMGGTSTDVCVIRKGQAQTTHQVIFGGLPVRGSMLDINTVGAGAGSLAYRDSDGTLCVGPESAGAAPGPVCYGTGGIQPTVTDANLVLGRLNPERRLGDRIQLHLEHARHALAKMAREIGTLSVDELAEGVIRIAVAKMAGAIREISVSRGLDPRRFTLVAYGGAGPMHAALVARELGMTSVLIPQMPGNFSALGLLTAELRWELAESIFAMLDNKGVAAVREAERKLKDAIARQLECERVSVDQLEHELWVEMHYVGQASSFSVRVPTSGTSVDELRRLFLAQYEERYGHASATRAISLDGVRVIATARGRKPDFAKAGLRRQDNTSRLVTRPVVFDKKTWQCPVYWRTALSADSPIEGPAIIEESGSTTVIPPGWQATVDALQNLRLIATKEAG